MHRDQIAFLSLFGNLQEEVYRIACKNGFHPDGQSDGELIALMHSELSEALECLRKDPGTSDKIPPHSEIAEELADVIIRIMDYAGLRNLNVAGALLAKIKYNGTRPYKHGKKF